MSDTQIVKSVEEVKGTLAKMQEQFAMALPKHIPAERFVRVAQTAIVNNPNLLTLDRTSLYVSFTQCAQEGLLPDGRESAIVPFAGKAKYMPMVAGICKKARNSGEVSVIDAQVVYEKDEYEAWVDEKGPHFKHKRNYGADRGKPILTYAYAIMKDGGVALEEIDEAQMAAIKAKARASDSPWKGPFEDEMRRKSALRRLAKYRLPSSSDLDLSFKQDDEFYDDQNDENLTTEEPKTTPSRLGKIVEAQATEVTEAPTAQEAAAKAKEVFPESREVKPPAPKPQPSTSGGLKIKGKIEDLKTQDSKDPSKPWRRFAVKIQGKYFGTFDLKIGEKMIAAVDGGVEATVTYKERNEQTKEGTKVFRDVIAFDAELPQEVEGEIVAAEEIPI